MFFYVVYVFSIFFSIHLGCCQKDDLRNEVPKLLEANFDSSSLATTIRGIEEGLGQDSKTESQSHSQYSTFTLHNAGFLPIEFRSSHFSARLPLR